MGVAAWLLVREAGDEANCSRYRRAVVIVKEAPAFTSHTIVLALAASFMTFERL